MATPPAAPGALSTIPSVSTTTSSTDERAPRPVQRDSRGQRIPPPVAPLQIAGPAASAGAGASPADPSASLDTRRSLIRQSGEAATGEAASTASTSSSTSKKSKSMKTTRYEDLKSKEGASKSESKDGAAAAAAGEPPKNNTRGKKMKEGAFFACVLLPLSCWYTRGGSRLNAAPTPDSAGKAAGALSVDDDEETRAVRRMLGVRRAPTAPVSRAPPLAPHPASYWHMHPAERERDHFPTARERSARPGPGLRGRSQTFTQGHARPAWPEPLAARGRSNSFTQREMRVSGDSFSHNLAAAAARGRSNSFTQREMRVSGDSFSHNPAAAAAARGRSHSFTRKGMPGRTDSFRAQAGIPRSGTWAAPAAGVASDYGVDQGPDVDGLVSSSSSHRVSWRR